MSPIKSENEDMKLGYLKTFELALIFTLMLMLALFLLRPGFDVTSADAKAKILQIEVEDIPVTQQVKLPPPPLRPSVPVPTESEEIPEDLTIETTELNWDLAELPPPPPPDEYGSIDNEYVFVAYDEAPTPIGGFGAILQHLKYPELAVKAGIEARVVVGVLIDTKGNSIKTQVLRSSGSPLPFDDAAQQVALKVKWIPARQRDRAVKVWVSVPIIFKLKEAVKVGT